MRQNPQPEMNPEVPVAWMPDAKTWSLLLLQRVTVYQMQMLLRSRQGVIQIQMLTKHFQTGRHLWKRLLRWQTDLLHKTKMLIQWIQR